jgi:hypothetical protein
VKKSNLCAKDKNTGTDMVGRDLWKELIRFHKDLAMTNMDDEEKLERALALLLDIYRYEHLAEYN